ncbi:DUF1648 domain-containing protein [Arthrobacter echini]|uniref:DUF1648 domain-containing protein n=1 Tax=Arthrobacter echini TaxID=1529066 RepID=A0A4S5E9T6_9MICC|nr:DUF1648 domain-containing protein [Arthrobacter echini]THJ68461.1 DUF1648 domain-containing protein [Arthrobacter echini]
MARSTQHDEGREPVGDYVEALRHDVPFRDGTGVLHYPTMRSRPQPSFVLDPLHRFLLIGSVVAALGYTIWIIGRIPSMPAQIPLHFSADGSVDRYGSPWEILIPACILLATIIGLAILTRYPRIYNYGVGRVTEENIQAHYRNGVQMMIWATFSATVLHIAALGSIAGDWSIIPGIWFGLGLLLGSMTFFILRMLRL